MNASERAALVDFVDSVIWPGRTVRTTTASESNFTLTSAWNVTYDLPMVWVNGNRYTGAVTWNNTTSIHTSTAITAGSLVVILVSPGSGANYLARTPGSAGMNGNLPMGNNRITGLGASVDPSDAVCRDEVDQILNSLIGAKYILKSGGTMTGSLILKGDAVLPLEPTTKRQSALLDGSQAFTAPQSGVSPTSDLHLSTKKYADDLMDALRKTSIIPNRMSTHLVPGIYTLNNIVIGRKYFLQIRGGSGGAGGLGAYAWTPWDDPNYWMAKSVPGGGGQGSIEELSFIAKTTSITLKVGGCGYDGGKPSGGAEGGGGGGGGSASQLINGSETFTAGGGGGGGGAAGQSLESPGGNGGAGGTSGQTTSGFGGTPGVGGAPGECSLPDNGGVGGIGSSPNDYAYPIVAQSGFIGGLSTSITDFTASYNESYVFSKDGLDIATVPGVHGAIILRWYEA